MATAGQVIPPIPIDAPFGAYGWVDWYNKVRNAINSAQTIAFTSITGLPTTLAGYGITNGAALTAGRTTNGVKTTDYVIVDSTTSGLTLKSPNGHYWVSSISNAGAVTWTDVGTTSP